MANRAKALSLSGPGGGKRHSLGAPAGRVRLGSAVGKDLVAVANPRKAGYLTVKKGPSNIKGSTFYFILGEDTLFMFNNERDFAAKGAFPLDDWVKTSNINDDKLTFDIIKLDNSFVRFKADSRESVAAWVSKLQESQAVRSDASLYTNQRARLEYTLHMKIWEAKSLAYSDTYAVVTAQSAEIGRTGVVWQNSSPFYHSDLAAKIDRRLAEVKVQVYGLAQGNRVEPIGSVSVQLVDAPEEPQWYTLSSRSSIVTPGSLGSLQLKLFKPPEGGLSFTVERVNLPTPPTRTASYSVSIYAGKGDFVTDASPNAVWTSGNEFRSEFSASPVVIEVSNNGECIGKLEISPEKFAQDSTYFQTNWPLSAPDKGQIRVSVKRSKSIVLDDEVYDPLFGLLVENNLELPRLVAQLPEADPSMLAEGLVKVFERRGMVVSYIKTLIAEQVRTTPNQQVLFRSNTLATKSLDALMRLIALPHLHKMLKPTIAEMYKGKKPCELDVKRMADGGKSLRKNQQNLIQYCLDVLKAVQDILNFLPLSLRLIFESMRRNIEMRWPGDDTVVFTGPSGFFFLRFVCPAILSPAKFGLAPEHPPTEIARDLTLLAKTLQTLANMTEFGKKEQFMAPMNEFVVSNVQAVKTFLKQLCQSPTSPIDDIPASHFDLNFGKEMAMIADFLDNHLTDLHKLAPTNALLPRLQTLLDDIQNKTQAYDLERQMSKTKTIRSKLKSNRKIEALFGAELEVQPPSTDTTLAPPPIISPSISPRSPSISKPPPFDPTASRPASAAPPSTPVDPLVFPPRPASTVPFASPPLSPSSSSSSVSSSSATSNPTPTAASAPANPPFRRGSLAPAPPSTPPPSASPTTPTFSTPPTTPPPSNPALILPGLLGPAPMRRPSDAPSYPGLTNSSTASFRRTSDAAQPSASAPTILRPQPPRPGVRMLPNSPAAAPAPSDAASLQREHQHSRSLSQSGETAAPARPPPAAPGSDVRPPFLLSAPLTQQSLKPPAGRNALQRHFSDDGAYANSKPEADSDSDSDSESSASSNSPVIGVQSLVNRNPDQPFSDRERRMMNVLRLLQERVNTMQAREELMREKMRELIREHQEYREETERISKQLGTLRSLLGDKS